jgi:hypothetical protein
MNEEFDALLQNGTWDLVPSSHTMNIIGCKWVFRIKRHADGSIERHKARLVAKCFHQQPGLDYGETFSPVVKPVTIRTVLSLAVARGWSIRQLDIKNAFLHGLLDEPVFMQQPPGFIHPQMPSHVCRLHKALYGLKQAPRAWFARLSSRLNDLGFLPSKSDSSLFILRTTHLTCFVLIYVDDIIVTCSDSSTITSFISQLGTEFAVKDLGPLNFFLGVEVLPVSDGLLLSQHRYITDLLRKVHMVDAKPVTSPMSSAHTLSQFVGDAFDDPTLYRSTVGALQ